MAKKGTTPSSLTLEGQMVSEARRIARAQNKLRRLRAEMKAAQAELRDAKRTLRALASSARDPMTPPMRLFGEEQS